MIGLLLIAQLVLPGPTVEGVQPPGMICMGDCEDGPMVYRAGEERPEWDLVCDMKSDTCSDGRTIATSRASPVPCETAPGVWEIVPEDTGCYSVRGLEVWGQNTSYLSWGAELDRGVWIGSVVEADLGYQITGSLSQSMETVATAESRTTSWILRADTPRSVTIGVQPTGGCEVDVGTEWATYYCTEDVAVGVSPEARITQPVEQVVYAIGAWHVRSDTPGRACWGGEAPVTCAADRHTISTEGWPTEAGEIVSVVRWAKESSGNAYIIDARTSEHLDSLRLLVSSVTEARRLFLFIGSELIAASASLEWEIGRTYVVSVERGSDGTITLRRDGSVLAEASGPALSWGDVATLGAQRSLISGQFLDGSLGPLRIRSTE